MSLPLSMQTQKVYKLSQGTEIGCDRLVNGNVKQGTSCETNANFHIISSVIKNVIFEVFNVMK